MRDDVGIFDGLAELDGEHTIQVSLITALEQGLALGQPRSRLVEILDQLLTYTRTHFHSELMLMDQFGYPGRDHHAAAHHALISQAERVAQDFSADEITTVSAELLSLRARLLEHIRRDDHAFHRFLEARTLAAAGVCQG
jgi:hemerythrin